MLTAALKSKTQALYQSRSLHQASILFLGKAGAQLVGLVSYPLLTRFYSPAQFGEFAFISSLVAILSIASSGRYESAQVVSSRKYHVKRLFQLAQVVLAGYTLLLLLVAHLPPLKLFLLQHLTNPHYLWIIPILVFLGGYWQIVQNWLIRFQQFTRLSAAIFIQRASILIASLGVLFLNSTINGLIIGLISGFLLIFGISLYYQRQPIRAPIKSLVGTAKRYQDFPLFSVPTLLLNLFSLHLPILWFTIFYNQETAGNYNLAYTLITIPITGLGISLGNVYYQELAQSRSDERFHLLKKYLTNYSIILLPAALITLSLGDWLTIKLLGDNWQGSAKIVVILAPLILTTGLTNLLMMAITVYRQQKFSLYINLCRLVFSFIALSAGVLLKDIQYTFYLMSLFSIMLFLGVCMLMFRISRKKDDTYSHRTLAI
jgi:lipopolysaccharide exporter